LGATVKFVEKFPFANSITQIKTDENVGIWLYCKASLLSDARLYNIAIIKE
jgi:hypothetical protein